MLRKTLIILISLLLLSSGVFAQEETTEEKAQPGKKSPNNGIGKPEEKLLIDFADLPESLAMDRWNIKLSGYSDNAFSRQHSILQLVDVDSTKLESDIKFNKCLGIRVHFEYSHGNDWAQIKTRLPLDPYYSKEGEGILLNVGPIKSISMWVAGRNFKNTIEVRMVDQNGKFKSINFGTLFFRGWRKLTWVNPDYIKDIKKRDIVKEHLYPRFSPYLKLDSIVIYKSHQEAGGDFVTYVKDIRVEYEPALMAIEATIDDEGAWHIQETKARLQKERLDKFYDIYFSGSSYEEQYLKDKAKDKARLTQ